MSSSERPDKSELKAVVFAQEAMDYGITGSRRWSDLSGWEQDEYLLTCFMGEAPRAAVERKLDLFDRTASSVADAVLGPFRQYDRNTGVSHYQPESPARAHRIQVMRMGLLARTPLGERLSLARTRQMKGRLGPDEYASDTPLNFYGLGPGDMAGLEILDEGEYGGLHLVNPYSGAWGDWDALELQQAREYASLQDERWEREMDPSSLVAAVASAHASAAPAAPPPVAPTPLPRGARLTAEAAAQSPPLGSVALASAMIAWALLPFNPYGYYVLLRWVCVAVFLYLASQSSHRRNWAITFVAAAVVYNPIVPLALGRPLWSTVNIATLAILGIYAAVSRFGKS